MRDDDHVEEFPRTLPRPFPLSDFAGRKFPERRWLVQDLLPAGTTCSLDGPGGGGKSLLALQLCCSVALGRPWLGRDVMKGSALFATAEDEENEVHRRAANLAVAFNCGLEDLTAAQVWPLASVDPVLAVQDPRGGLALTAIWQEFEALVTEQRPTLAVLDARADFYAASEIDRSLVRAFLGALRRLAQATDTAVLLVGHPALSRQATDGSAGSTAWRNSVRAALSFTRPPADEHGHVVDPDARILRHEKSNYGPLAPDMRLRRGAGVFHLESSAPTSAFARAAEAREVEALFLELLARFSAQGRWVRDTSGHGYAPAEFAKDPAANGVTNAGFAAAMRSLFAAGRIKMEEFGSPSRGWRRMVAVTPEEPSS